MMGSRCWSFPQTVTNTAGCWWGLCCMAHRWRSLRPSFLHLFTQLIHHLQLLSSVLHLKVIHMPSLDSSFRCSLATRVLINSPQMALFFKGFPNSCCEQSQLSAIVGFCCRHLHEILKSRVCSHWETSSVFCVQQFKFRSLTLQIIITYYCTHKKKKRQCKKLTSSIALFET